MALMYGLPPGSNIPYGAPGFPQWVYDLAAAFNLQASTYPGHQEGDRAERGFVSNPQRLNRGIDWTGSVGDMQRFAEYLLSVKSYLEQVIWENPQTAGQRIGVAGGDDVSDAPYYNDDYANHRDHVHVRVSAPIPLPKDAKMRPDYNEFPLWSPNNQARNGTKIDLFLLHTQEGAGNALSLAQFLANPANQVSYHYTVSQDLKDNGVTVVDCVDTDRASWSVLSANNRSINLCFAGSSVSWTRDQWMRNSKAIDAAAWLAVQDCKKYKIPFTVIAPPYGTARAGISDHAYVTKVLRDGSHTDIGPNFPWTYFAGKVAEYSGTTISVTPTPVPPTLDRIDPSVEWSAFLGDQAAVAAIVQAAKRDGRARLVLAAIERSNPAALQAFITRG